MSDLGIQAWSARELTMNRLVVGILILLAIFLVSCGEAPPPPKVSGSCQAPAIFTSATCKGRCLASITVCPTSADAQSSSAPVQFTATGNFTEAPYTVTPQPAAWGVCQNDAPTTQVSISSAGLAECGSSAKGAYTVFAFDMTECNAISACGEGCSIRGTAQLTCP